MRSAELYKNTAMKKGALFALLCWAGTAVATPAESAAARVLEHRGTLWRRTPMTAREMPNPTTDPYACGLSGPDVGLCDPFALLPDAEAAVALAHLQRANTGDGFRGAQITLVFVKTLDTSAEAFSKDLMDLWGVGSAARNTGVVVAVAVGNGTPGTGDLAILSGAGVRSTLGGYTSDMILDAAVPLLQQERYGEAAVLLSHKVSAALAGALRDPRDRAIDCIPYLAAAAAVRAAYRAYMRRRAEAALDRLDAFANSTEYVTLDCPVCMEVYSDSLTKSVLPCGHSACRTCLRTIAARASTCMICRRPFVLGEAPRRAELPAPNWFSQEYSFRANQFSTTYGHYGFERDFLNDLRSGSNYRQPWRTRHSSFREARRQREIAEAAAAERRRAAAAKSTKNKRSFGGGTSRGSVAKSRRF